MVWRATATSPPGLACLAFVWFGCLFGEPRLRSGLKDRPRLSFIVALCSSLCGLHCLCLLCGALLLLPTLLAYLLSSFFENIFSLSALSF